MDIENEPLRGKVIVGFLDILGYDWLVKKMIDDIGFDEKFDSLMYGITVDMLERFKNTQPSASTQDEAYFKEVIASMKIRFIYDNIIFSLPLSAISFRSQKFDKKTTILNCIETFFYFISLFSVFFIRKMGLLLRGCISIGSHYESEKNNYLMIFSEAHNKAVHLEGEANDPRIILEESLRSYLEEISYPHLDKLFYIDPDGLHCLDIYSVFDAIGNTQDFLTDIKNGLMQNLNYNLNLNNKKELGKIIYFAKYHNRQVGNLNFPELALNIDKYEQIIE